jgi:allantoin racemase
MHLAAQLGTRFSILTTSSERSGPVRARLRALGVADLFASIRGVGCSVMELARQDPRALAEMVAVGRDCADKDGADVLVLRCMSMAFLPNATQLLRDEVGVPVVSPPLTALKVAEMAVKLDLRGPSA